MERRQKFGVLAHAIAVAADIDDVAVMEPAAAAAASPAVQVRPLAAYEPLAGGVA